MGSRGTDTQGAPGIRTFLIADVRGYTLFTQERGDEAATKLAARFAQIARQVVDEHGGSVIELRGDEAPVFDSARQAILAAVRAQDRFLEATIADPAFPLPVGIGLDAGEAVPLEAGYRGGALNLAARLCGRAGPGEILASQGVVHLARKVEGVRYADRGDLYLKGLTESVRVVKVVSVDGDPAPRLREFAPKRASGPLSIVQRHPAASIVVALALIAAIAIPASIAGRGSPRPSPKVAVLNSVISIDASTRTIGSVFDVGATPVAVDVEGPFVWTANAGEGTLTWIDTATGFQRTIRLPLDVTFKVPGPASGCRFCNPAVAIQAIGSLASDGQGGVWVAGRGRQVVHFDRRLRMDRTFRLPEKPLALVQLPDGSLWETTESFANGEAIQVDPSTGRALARIEVSAYPLFAASGFGDLWVLGTAGQELDRISPATHEITKIDIPSDAWGLAVDQNAVWVGGFTSGKVYRIDRLHNTIIDAIGFVGYGVTFVLSDGEHVWVGAGASSRTLTEVDAAQNMVVHTIQLGQASSAGAIGDDGTIWVTIAPI